MREMQIDVLSGVVAKLVESSSLTPAERSELLRIAQGARSGWDRQVDCASGHSATRRVDAGSDHV